MKHSVKRREDQLLRAVPDIVGYKTILYIGANLERMEMVSLLANEERRIDALEVWPENHRELADWNDKAKVFRNVVLGDVRELLYENAYDVVMWWHGPEHVAAAELPDILKRLERAARHLVVLACPSGKSVQGAAYGNPYEEHRASIYASDMRDLGYRINILGKTDKPNSNLIAWRRMS
jgi:hypothetical protein